MENLLKVRNFIIVVFAVIGLFSSLFNFSRYVTPSKSRVQENTMQAKRDSVFNAFKSNVKSEMARLDSLDKWYLKWGTMLPSVFMHKGRDLSWIRSVDGKIINDADTTNFSIAEIISKNEHHIQIVVEDQYYEFKSLREMKKAQEEFGCGEKHPLDYANTYKVKTGWESVVVAHNWTKLIDVLRTKKWNATYLHEGEVNNLPF